MDPLFGFVDDISEHSEQQQTTPSSGGCTISFPANTTTAAAVQGFLQSQQQNQMAGSSQGSSQQPVVRVVTGKSEDNQQIYVIKLENLFQQNTDLGGNQVDGAAGGSFENGSSGVGGGMVEPVAGEERHNLAGDEEDGRSAEDEDDEPEPDPFLVVSPESVMAMAQSVGVDLNEDDASELGCLATNKLRQAVLVAMQFSQHENSAGITVEQFSKAEEELGGPSGLGHKSVFRESFLKYAGGVSVVDDGPEIDLYASISRNLKEPRKIPIEPDDPILHVHHLLTPNDSNAFNNNSSSNFNLYDEPVVSLVAATDDEASNNEQSPSSNPNSEGASQNSGGSENSSSNNSTNEADTNGNGEISEITLPEEMQDEEIVDELLKSSGETRKGNNSEPPLDCEDEGDGIAPEWSAYLEVLLKLTVSQKFTEGYNYILSSEFKLMLDDLRRNGAHPVFHVICDTFRDYLRNPSISLASIVNMIAVVDALVTSKREPTQVQMTDLGSVLIEIIILPPPCEIHHLLTNTFMKVLTTCNELLTWTCTYVTEMLKGIGEIPMNHFQDPLKCTMHGALCLANGLEEINIQVAQEFGWHLNVVNFSRNHSTVFDGNKAYSLNQQDSYLEEEILKFYHNFLHNYTGLVVPTELSKLQETVTSMYGDRFLSFSPETAPAASTERSNSNYSNNSATKPAQPSTKSRCMYMTLTYRNRDVILPCRKVLK